MFTAFLKGKVVEETGTKCKAYKYILKTTGTKTNSTAPSLKKPYLIALLMKQFKE
jgi:hypothetical protein